MTPWRLAGAALLAGALLAACGTQGVPLSARQRASVRTACRGVFLSVSSTGVSSAPTVGQLIAEGMRTGVASIERAAHELRDASRWSALSSGSPNLVLNAVTDYEAACQQLAVSH